METTSLCSSSCQLSSATFRVSSRLSAVIPAAVIFFPPSSFSCYRLFGSSIDQTKESCCQQVAGPPSYFLCSLIVESDETPSTIRTLESTLLSVWTSVTDQPTWPSSKRQIHKGQRKGRTGNQSWPFRWDHSEKTVGWFAGTLIIEYYWARRGCLWKYQCYFKCKWKQNAMIVRFSKFISRRIKEYISGNWEVLSLHENMR